MRPNIYSLILVSGLFFLTSCSKWFYPEDKMLGTWKLTEAERKRAFNTENIQTGYESGVFVFNENGTASYTDAIGILTGNWLLKRVNYTTSNSSGQATTDTNTILSLKIYDFPSNRFIDWQFDEIDFKNSGKKLLATIKGANYEYRYWFVKQ